MTISEFVSLCYLAFFVFDKVSEYINRKKRD